MFQGGDPLGNGSGGSAPRAPPTTTPLSDEFNPDIRFTSNGLLALANSGPDTNDCQFFVTAGQQRELDYGYTDHRQDDLGQRYPAGHHGRPDRRRQYADDSHGTPSKPEFTVTINSISVVPDMSDALIMLKGSTVTTNPVSVTVTLRDTAPPSQNVGVTTDSVSSTSGRHTSSRTSR